MRRWGGHGTMEGIRGLAPHVSRRNPAATPAELLAAQSQIIDLMAGGAALAETLRRIALLVEEIAPPALCSILLLDPDGRHLTSAAGPSLPAAYNAAINGVEIG